ncbi:hypothetical protein VTG60DRAFT_1070 [Thermothelomyces hinnuleus]
MTECGGSSSVAVINCAFPALGFPHITTGAAPSAKPSGARNGSPNHLLESRAVRTHHSWNARPIRQTTAVQISQVIIIKTLSLGSLPRPAALQPKVRSRASRAIWELHRQNQLTDMVSSCVGYVHPHTVAATVHCAWVRWRCNQPTDDCWASPPTIKVLLCACLLPNRCKPGNQSNPKGPVSRRQIRLHGTESELCERWVQWRNAGLLVNAVPAIDHHPSAS